MIVTVVGDVVKLAGVSHAFTVHPLKIYPLAVFGVAEIFTDVPYLYVVHHPFTLLIHVHTFNVNVYVFLAYQHAYVWLAAFALAAFVAALVPGFHTLVCFLVLRVHGDVHRFANVKLVHHEIT